MEQLRANIHVYQIDEEKTPFYENMDKYYSVKSGCLHFYWVEYDVSARLEECSRFITRYKAEELVERQRNRDPEAIIEIAVRLEPAAHHANESIKLGLVSHASLVVGFKMRELAATLGVDVTQLRGARRFRALWIVVEQRVEELYAAERASQKKFGRRPEAYLCALEGCGVRAEQRAGLKSCNGNCPPDLKPRYCSKDVQVEDWSRHKPICKHGCDSEDPGDIYQQQSTATSSIRGATPHRPQPENELSTRNELRWNRGPARTLDIPVAQASCGVFRMTSNTMEFELMKSVSEESQNITRERGGARPNPS
ncbi:hypothetical protein C8Q74DRAFT_1366131 [Fomes fomentarius]|nr:hypothetical protein C8Q74DRAFT_1366131 [Fomes fomentarius]